MNVERRGGPLRQTWGAEGTVNSQGIWDGARGCGGVKGQNIPSAPRVRLEQQSCITRKHLGPTGEKASVYRRLIDIPFVPWKVLIYWTWTNCLSLICAQSWEMKLSPHAGAARLHTKHVSLTENGNLFSHWQRTWLCLILVSYSSWGK